MYYCRWKFSFINMSNWLTLITVATPQTTKRINWRENSNFSIQEMSRKLILEHFLKTTSSHGCAKLSELINNPRRKLVWLIIIILAFGLFAYHMYTFVAKFIEDPVSTKIKFNIQDNLYPSVTICYNMPYFIKNYSNAVPSIG